MTSHNAGQELTLGQHLEAARQQAGYSLRQLARLSGLHPSAVNRLLKDEVEQPAPDNLIALARALELNETDLFLLAGLPVPQEGASLTMMLRKGYGISDEQVPELAKEIETLIAAYTKEGRGGRKTNNLERGNAYGQD